VRSCAPRVQTAPAVTLRTQMMWRLLFAQVRAQATHNCWPKCAEPPCQVLSGCPATDHPPPALHSLQRRLLQDLVRHLRAVRRRRLLHRRRQRAVLLLVLPYRLQHERHLPACYWLRLLGKLLQKGRQNMRALPGRRHLRRRPGDELHVHRGGLCCGRHLQHHGGLRLRQRLPEELHHQGVQ
jgi:hypothetical protein